VGLVFFITGVASLLSHFAEWAFAPHDPIFRRESNAAGIIIAAFKSLAGIWLLCGFRGVMRGLRWILQAGRTLGVREGEDNYEKE